MNRQGAAAVELDMRSLVLASLFLVAACTPMQWEKADVTPEQFAADEEDCRRYAWREANFRAWHYNTMIGPVRDPQGRGLFIWPTTPMMDPYGHQLMEEQRLAQFCMEHKGYQLVPAPKQ